MSALNLHKLFAGTATTDGFRQNISLSQSEQVGLSEAREAVRERLRLDFRALTEAANDVKQKMLVKSLQTFDRAAALQLRPKFRGQGSWSYSTINSPAYSPPQQVDVDDGVYLPTSFVNTHDPAVAADAYFAAVERSLQALCRARAWVLNQDTSSCVRIILDTRAHLDLALYAIPDEQFADEESLAKALRSNGTGLTEDRNMVVLSEAQYRSLPGDRIMLAQRNGTWEMSDPRKLEDWFNAAKRSHGDILRFTCRYLKAWRDYQWRVPKTGPSSICLMACTVQAFEQAGYALAQNREDSALRLIASRLPDILAGAIQNPAVEGAANLDDDWTYTKRHEFIAKAVQLHDNVVRAMAGPSVEVAIALLQETLGQRLPDEVSLAGTEEEARILSTPPRKVAAPVVARSTSG